jgi:hypothetical protein
MGNEFGELNDGLHVSGKKAPETAVVQLLPTVWINSPTAKEPIANSVLQPQPQQHSPRLV